MERKANILVTLSLHRLVAVGLGGLALSFMTAIGTVLAAETGDDCSSVVRDLPLASTVASASTWDNIRSAEGSVGVESRKLLAQAELQLGQHHPPEALCPAGCSPVPKPEIVLDTVPNKLLTQYSEFSFCAKRLEQTSNNPLSYQGRRFSDIDHVAEWFSDFSQGRGEDGADLYRRCDGSCSPRYQTAIERTSTGYQVAATVICGHARDRDDDRYQLRTAVRWRCERA